MNSSVNHAPSTNFATSTTTTVTPVTNAPNPFTSAYFLQCGALAFHQCRTIPACESVNARNAPTAYNGINRSVTPPNRNSSTPANTASTTIPCVYTSLRPRCPNPCGR